MMADLMIYKIVAVLLLISIVRRQALPAAFLLCLSFAVDRLMFVEDPTWEELESRFLVVSIKDISIAWLLGMRKEAPEIVLAIIFAACCLYHHAIFIEVQNSILTLKRTIPDVMLWVTSLQLAVVIMIIIKGSASNGGKRAKHNLSNLNAPINRFLHSQAFKVTK